MQIAMLYAAWDGEGWSTPIGIRNELELRGHEVKLYNLYHNNGEPLRPGQPRTYSADCLNKLNFDMKNSGYQPDAVFQMDYGVFDAPQLDKRFFPNTAWVMEAGDEPQSHRMQWQKANKFHAVLSPDWPCVERYRQAGLLAEWWTHHADTTIFYRRPEIEPWCDVITTCGPRGHKGGVTAPIEKALGTRFNNERYFYGEDHPKRLNMGRMVFQCSQHGEITRRIFEGMACGKMVITDRLRAETRIEDIFVHGEDIVYYDSPQDAIDKINYYTNHPEERERIAANGMAKVYAEHTCTQRVDVLEDVIRQIQHKVLV